MADRADDATKDAAYAAEAKANAAKAQRTMRAATRGTAFTAGNVVNAFTTYVNSKGTHVVTPIPIPKKNATKTTRVKDEPPSTPKKQSVEDKDAHFSNTSHGTPTHPHNVSAT